MDRVEGREVVEVEEDGRLDHLLETASGDLEDGKRRVRLQGGNKSGQ